MSAKILRWVVTVSALCVTGSQTLPRIYAQSRTGAAGQLYTRCADPVIGENLETTCTVGVSVTGAEQLSTTDLTVVVTSDDPKKLLVSTTDAGSGSESITLKIPAGSSGVTFSAQATANDGSVSYSVSGKGVGNVSGSVKLGPSGFVLAGPYGLRGGPRFFTAKPAGPTVLLVVYSAVLHPDYTLWNIQHLRGGIKPVEVVLNSTTSAPGTVKSSAVVAAGSDRAEVAFQPGTAGTTTVSLVTPQGFGTPKNFQNLAVHVLQ